MFVILIASGVSNKQICCTCPERIDVFCRVMASLRIFILTEAMTENQDFHSWMGVTDRGELVKITSSTSQPRLQKESFRALRNHSMSCGSTTSKVSDEGLVVIRPETTVNAIFVKSNVLYQLLANLA